MRTILMGAALGAVALAADHVPTGPAVGATIPAFEAIDLNSHPQTLSTLTGPKGLMLVFLRSADW
jgi:hypothetical protein